MTSNFSQLSTDALSPGQLPESVKALLKRLTSTDIQNEPQLLMPEQSQNLYI